MGVLTRIDTLLTSLAAVDAPRRDTSEISGHGERDLARRGAHTLSGVTVPTVTIAGTEIPITEAWSLGRMFQRRIPALYRARLMTINAVAQLPVAAWKGIDELDRQPPIVTTPDPRSTQRVFVADTIAMLLDHGTVFWLVDRLDRDGLADRVRVSSQHGDDRVDVMWDNSGTRRVYRQRDRVLRPGVDVIDLALGRGPDELLGQGPMQSTRIAGVDAALQYAQEYFSTAATPSGYLTSDFEITDTEADAAVDRWESKHQGNRVTAALGGGMRYEREDLAAPGEAEWTTTHMAGIVDIADLFGIPPTLLGASMPGSTSNVTYQNLADVYEAWWRQTLQPDLVAPIEEAWTRLVRRGTDVRFDPAVLIRGDRTRRYGAHAIGLNAGFLTVDEVRAEESLPPLGGDAGGTRQPAPPPEPATEEEPVAIDD